MLKSMFKPNFKILLTLPLILALLPACEQDTTPEPNENQNLQSTVIIQETGLYPNQILLDHDYGYIVSSGDNIIERFRLDDPTQHTKDFINLGINQNPFSLTITETHLFIVNLLGKSITVATKDGKILKTLTTELFSDPEYALFANEMLLVTDTEYTKSYENPEHQWGSLILIQNPLTQPVYRRIPTSCNNPQYITQHQGELIVVGSGGVSYADGISTPNSNGCIDFFDLQNLLTATQPNHTLTLEPTGIIGNPGSLAIAEDILYLGSGTAATVFTIDLKTHQWLNGIENPIHVASASSNGMLTLTERSGDVFAVNFNTDNLYKIKAPNLNPLESWSLSTNPELILGILSMQFDDHKNLYTLNSLQRTVSKTPIP